MKKIVALLAALMITVALAVPEFAVITDCGEYFSEPQENMLCYVYDDDMTYLSAYFSFNYAGFYEDLFTLFPNKDGFYFNTEYYRYAVFQREPGKSLIVLLPF
jgi:hypothetical protein